MASNTTRQDYKSEKQSDFCYEVGTELLDCWCSESLGARSLTQDRKYFGLRIAGVARCKPIFAVLQKQNRFVRLEKNRVLPHTCGVKARIFAGIPRLLERVDPGNALPDDQRVHIVRAFVGLHRL
jgi:hypothetical protein